MLDIQRLGQILEQQRLLPEDSSICLFLHPSMCHGNGGGVMGDSVCGAKYILKMQ